VGFFFAAGEGSGPATFEGDSADAGDQPIMLHQVSIAIFNWIHAPKTLEVLGQRALPFTAAAVDRSAMLSGQSIVGLQLQRAVELCQRHLVLAMTPIEE
jgi:hypothetical protein